MANNNYQLNKWCNEISGKSVPLFPERFFQRASKVYNCMPESIGSVWWPFRQADELSPWLRIILIATIFSFFFFFFFFIGATYDFFCQYVLTEIRLWIKYSHCFLWDVVTDPSPKLNGDLHVIKIRAWLSDLFYMGVITDTLNSGLILLISVTISPGHMMFYYSTAIKIYCFTEICKFN